VPKEARWAKLQASAKQPTIGKLIDDAMVAIEKENPCCGSGGMFVQSERFVEERGGRLGDIAIYRQEFNISDLTLISCREVY
jgi:type I restriction-modification system DNA methylase subunit